MVALRGFEPRFDG